MSSGINASYWGEVQSDSLVDFKGAMDTKLFFPC